LEEKADRTLGMASSSASRSMSNLDPGPASSFVCKDTTFAAPAAPAAPAPAAAAAAAAVKRRIRSGEKTEGSVSARE